MNIIEGFSGAELAVINYITKNARRNLKKILVESTGEVRRILNTDAVLISIIRKTEGETI